MTTVTKKTSWSDAKLSANAYPPCTTGPRLLKILIAGRDEYRDRDSDLTRHSSSPPVLPFVVWLTNPLAAGSQMGILCTHHALELFFFHSFSTQTFKWDRVAGRQTPHTLTSTGRADQSFLFFPYKARAYIQPTICNAPKNYISFYFHLWTRYRMSKEQLL